MKMKHTSHLYSTFLLFYFLVIGNTYTIAQEPCGTNISMASAKNIELIDRAESCVSGCTTNMPVDTSFKDNYNCKYQGAASWFKFKSSDLNSVKISIKSATLKNLKYNILDENGIQIGCSEISFYFAQNKQYYIVVFEPDSQPGEFEICLVGYYKDPYSNYQSLFVMATSLGSPSQGPYKPGETLRILYQKNHNACYGQYLHYFVPIYGKALSEFNDYPHNLISYDFEKENAVFQEINSDEISWKPETTDLNSLRGIIQSTNIPCILGTPECIPISPGLGKCSGYGESPLKSGWAFMTQGCISDPEEPHLNKSDFTFSKVENEAQNISVNNGYLDPNFSWGIKQQIFSNVTRSLTYELTIPYDIKEINNQFDTDEFYIGFTTYTDGQTGGFSYNDNCPETDIVYLNLDVIDCKNSYKITANDTIVCSRKVFEKNFSYDGKAINYFWKIIDSKNVEKSYNPYKHSPGKPTWFFANDTKEVGFVKIIVYAIDSAYCTSAIDTFTVTVNPTSVYAGSDSEYGSCSEIKLNGVAIGPSEWTTNGDGHFIDRFKPQTSYIRGIQDSINGKVKLNLQLTDTTGILLCNGNNDDINIKIITSKLLNKIKDFEMCNKDTVINLHAVPGNGTWEGHGVYYNKLYPHTMNFGTHKLLYRWRDIYYCNYVDTLTVTITNCLCVMDAELKSNPAVCSAANGSLEVKVLNTVQGPFQYYWNTGATTPVVNDLKPGIYIVIVYYADQCSLELRDTVKANNKFAKIDTLIENCQYKVCINSAYTNDFEVTWDNGSKEKCIYLPLQNEELLTAEVIAYDDCRDTVKFVPDAIIVPLDLEIESIDNIVHSNEGYITIKNNGTADTFTVNWYRNNIWFSSDQNISDLIFGYYVCIAEDIYGCKDTLETTIYKFGTIGTDEITRSQLRIFPNPANSTVNIISEISREPFIQIKLTNMLGETINKTAFKSSQDIYKMDCSDLPSGVYIIQILQNGITFQNKFIVVN